MAHSGDIHPFLASINAVLNNSNATDSDLISAISHLTELRQDLVLRLAGRCNLTRNAYEQSASREMGRISLHTQAVEERATPEDAPVAAPRTSASSPGGRSARTIHLHTASPSSFPPAHISLAPASHDFDKSPLYFGRAYLANGCITPCKLIVKRDADEVICYAPFDGHELWHEGAYDLVPFDRERMELVRVESGVGLDAGVYRGEGPARRSMRPVRGGKEHGRCEAGEVEMWHAVAEMRGEGGVRVRTPGKAAVHLVSEERCAPIRHDVQSFPELMMLLCLNL
jgi:hypothetical protein